MKKMKENRKSESMKEKTKRKCGLRVSIIDVEKMFVLLIRLLALVSIVC